MKLSFKDFAAVDLEKRQAVFLDAFPETPGASASSVDHYQWKFKSFPDLPPSFEFEASEDGQMLGYYAALPYPYMIAGKSYKAGMVCDVMTHSKARGKGVFTNLGRYSLQRLQSENVDFVTGYPVRPEVIPGHLKVGWTIAFELPLYVKFLRFNSLLSPKGLGFLAPLVNVGGLAYRCALRPGVKDKALRAKILSLNEFLASAELDPFLEEWRSGIENCLVKSTRFYRWRLGAPTSQYRIHVVHRDGKWVGLAIARKTDLKGIPTYALIDLMVIKGQESSLPLLHREIENEARANDAEAIATMMSGTSCKAYHLIRHGFLRSPFAFKLIVNSLRTDLPVDVLHQEEKWHLMWVDSDDL